MDVSPQLSLPEPNQITKDPYNVLLDSFPDILRPAPTPEVKYGPAWSVISHTISTRTHLVQIESLLLISTIAAFEEYKYDVSKISNGALNLHILDVYAQAWMFFSEFWGGKEFFSHLL